MARPPRGAARLRDAVAPLALGVGGLGGFDVAFPEVVLVVEGQARGIEGVEGVTVVAAPASGDDTIADLATPVSTVVTADRELRSRCEGAGASVVGPRWLLDRVDYGSASRAR
ncbi:NTP pyrophosphohydrolase [Actinokineospora soli]|uniref:NTP pyrophosphohydrolase n=1 Tax=Actinokineospora soli TaxID=1048753 RepID=A0ABW2TS01_9PSEU